MPFEAAQRTSQGARPQQEDSSALWPGSGVIALPELSHCEPGCLIGVLADGMGGHAAGALASQMACEHFLSGFATAVGSKRDRLRAGLMAANHAIATKVDSNRALAGMGSTLIGAAFGPSGLEWVSVGDSPLYLWRRGEIALINEDHSLAPALDLLARSGKISAEEARNDPRRHMLRSAVTGEDIELIDLAVKPLSLEPGDYVILASDGIHALEESEIARTIQAYAVDGADAIASALLRAVEAVRDPLQDNTTVVVVRPIAG